MEAVYYRKLKHKNYISNTTKEVHLLTCGGFSNDLRKQDLTKLK